METVITPTPLNDIYRNAVKQSCVLVVEDDETTASLLHEILKRSGYRPTIANTVQSARQALKFSVPDIALVDLGLPDGDGLTMIRELREAGTESIVVVSGANDPNVTLSCLRAGVVDYLQKPVSSADLKVSLRGIRKTRYSQTVEMMIDPYKVTPGFGSLFGCSPTGRQLEERINVVAACGDSPTLIKGEAGVLKNEVAALIHSRRGVDGSLVYVNCASEVDASADSRFFGLLDRSFDERGPVLPNANVSYLQQAMGGTLLLDDISSLPKHLQISMTRYIDSGSYFPVGALDAVSSQCAVVGILRESARVAIDEGRLVPEFYYALAKSELNVPPLRDRYPDIPEFIDRAVKELNRVFCGEKAVSHELHRRLRNYDWPGNLVEFKNVLLTAYLATEAGEEMVMDSRLLPCLQTEFDQNVSNLVGSTFWEVEKKLVTATLKSVNGNKQKTAKLLGISLKTLYNRMNAYELGSF